jgi:hypothetical protein
LSVEGRGNGEDRDFLGGAGEGKGLSRCCFSVGAGKRRSWDGGIVVRLMACGWEGRRGSGKQEGGNDGRRIRRHKQV